MNHFFVDYENVRNDGLKGIDELDENNSVYIFYTENSNTLTFDTLSLMNKSKANIVRIKVEAGGKNALDFQLSTFLGYKVSHAVGDSYTIISKDKGFGFIRDFWGKANVYVGQKINCFDGLTEKKEIAQPEEVKLIDSLPQEITDLFQSSKNKSEVHNRLVKLYGAEKAGVIYKEIKPMIGKSAKK